MTEKEEILKGLFDSVVDGNADAARAFAQRSIEAKIPPMVALENGLTPGIKEVGDRFGRLECYLPEMVLSADAMQEAIAILEPYLKVGEATKKGKILIGTVKGDIHDLGKNIAIGLLKVSGYEVVDLGRDVNSQVFVDQAKKIGADIIGMSGLLTTSLPMMGDVIELLLADGVRDRYQVIIGGGPTSQEWADRIGADGYANTAVDGVNLCDRLIATVHHRKV